VCQPAAIDPRTRGAAADAFSELQEVRIRVTTAHPKVLVDDRLSCISTCRGRPPAAKVAAKPIDTDRHRSAGAHLGS
jgi:hypothetical protein